MPIQKQALEASYGTKIITLTDKEVTDPLISILTEAYEILGQKVDVSITSTIKMLRIELKTYFSTYTIEEVRASVRMALAGQLCDFKELQYPIVSVANICKFIHLYNEKVRREAIHQQNRYLQMETKEQEIQKAIEGNISLDAEIQSVYEVFKDDKAPFILIEELLKSCYFRRIRERGDNVLDKETMNQIKAVAELQIPEFEDLPKQFQFNYRAKRETFEIERDSDVKSRAQSIALKSIFEIWIRSGK